MESKLLMRASILAETSVHLGAILVKSAFVEIMNIGFAKVVYLYSTAESGLRTGHLDQLLMQKLG